MKTPETEMGERKPRNSDEIDLKVGQVIYLQGDGRQYVIKHPTWVKRLPEERYEDLPRGGWMP